MHTAFLFLKNPRDPGVMGHLDSMEDKSAATHELQACKEVGDRWWST